MNERKVEVRLQRGAQLNLGFFSRFSQTLQCHAIGPQIDAVIFLELAGDPVDATLIEVVAPEVRIAIGGLDFEDTVAELEDSSCRDRS